MPNNNIFNNCLENRIVVELGNVSQINLIIGIWIKRLDQTTKYYNILLIYPNAQINRKVIQHCNVMLK